MSVPSCTLRKGRRACRIFYPIDFLFLGRLPDACACLASGKRDRRCAVTEMYIYNTSIFLEYSLFLPNLHKNWTKKDDVYPSSFHDVYPCIRVVPVFSVLYQVTRCLKIEKPSKERVRGYYNRCITIYCTRFGDLAQVAALKRYVYARVITTNMH
jgi:hypothetical protein